MNNKDNRSVIDRLNDIENSFGKKSTISEKIGEPFDKYLKTAKVFLYESDIRAFNASKKKKKNLILILLICVIIITIIGVFDSIKNKNFSCDIIISYCALILIPIIHLLILSKQKHKTIANSKWLNEKYEFYIHENKLKYEIKKGELLILFDILTYMLLVIVFVYSVKNLGTFFGVMNIVAVMPIASLNTLCICSNPNYSYFVFEKSDSYVITNLKDLWEKHKK